MKEESILGSGDSGTATGRAYLDWIGWIVIIAGVFAIIAGYSLVNHDVIASWGDPVEYMEGAENLAQYDSAYHPPFYPVAIAAVRLITGDTFLAGKLVSYLAGLLIIVFTWLLGRLCFKSSSVAVLAASLVVFSPIIIRYSYAVASDTFGAALFLASLYALAVSSKGSLRALIVAGLIGGLAYMTRTIYMAILPAAVLFLVVMPGTKKQKFNWILLYVAMFALVVSPWAVINFMRHGNLNNLNYANIAFAAFDKSDSWLLFDNYAEKYQSAWSIFIQHPKAIARHFAKNVVTFPFEILVKQCYFAGSLAVLGFFALLRRPSVERLALIFGGSAVLLLTFLAWLNARFFIPIIPIVMLFSAHLIIRCISRTAASFWPRNASARNFISRIPLRGVLVGLAIVTAVGVATVRVPSDFARANINDEKYAGQFLAANTPENTPIMSSSRNLAWYAGRPFISMNLLEEVSPEDLEKAVRATRAKVLVYTKRHSVWTHPQLEYLLDPDDSRVPGSFRVLYRSVDDWPIVAYWVD